MTIACQFGLLGLRPLAFAEGIAMLREVRQELERDPVHAFPWGATSVIASAALVPLNVLVHALLSTPPVLAMHQQVVRDVYARFAAVGRQANSRWFDSLEALAAGLQQGLHARGLTAHLPTVAAVFTGVSATLNLCEDLERMDVSSPEHLAVIRDVAQALEGMQRLVRLLGTEHARSLAQMRRFARVA